MKTWLAYLRAGRSPVLLRDGFSLWAFLFGPLWLLLHAAWIPALLLLAANLVLSVALHGPAAPIAGLGLAWLVGLYGQEWRGWSLARRGWRLAHVIAARDHDGAYARLLTGHPEYQADAAL